MIAKFRSAEFQTALQGWLTLGWICAIPLSILWRDSLIWVVFMSHYAIIAAHAAAWEAARDG